MVLGSPGGTQILQFVTKTLIGAIDWKLNAQDAVNTGHFGAQLSRTTYLERDSAVAKHRAALEAKGHNIVVVDLNSGIHTIMVGDLVKQANRAGLAPQPKQAQTAMQAGGSDPRLGVGADSRLTGGADPRREGLAAGR